MCMTTSGTLTLASMLDDPMIQAMMRSDGVSEHDHAALLFRVRNTLADRNGADRAVEAQVWRTGVPSTVMARLAPVI
jgi:hypothetical protein